MSRGGTCSQQSQVHYHSLYYKGLDVSTSATKSRFNQKDFSVHCNLQQLMVKHQKNDYSNELMMMIELYSFDFNKSDLETQFEMFSSIDIQPSGRFLNNDDIHQHSQLFYEWLSKLNYDSRHEYTVYILCTLCVVVIWCANFHI